MTTNTSRRPLSGVRVLDLTRLLPGPVATLHLADQGADVIKIEAPGDGDYARTMGEGPEGVSRFFRTVNRNKRGLVLDLRQPAGRSVFLRLVASADLVVESFRPGVTARLGIGPEDVRAVNPRAVYCSISGYGQNGPWAQRAGHDLNYIAISGVLDGIGHAGGPPAIPNLQIGDLLGGALTAAFAMLAALHEARETGVGRHVDVAMAESVLAHHLFPLFAMQGSSGLAARGDDMLTGGQANYAVYPTRDGRYLAVAALEEKFWRAFCAAVGREDLGDRYAEVRDPRLRAEVAALVATRTRDEWAACLDAVDCCVTPVLDAKEALAHPQFVARGMSFTADGVVQYAPPVRFDDAPFPPPAPAPAPGADADSILAEAGFTADEMAALRAARVI